MEGEVKAHCIRALEQPGKEKTLGHGGSALLKLPGGLPGGGNIANYFPTWYTANLDKKDSPCSHESVRLKMTPLRTDVGQPRGVAR